MVGTVAAEHPTTKVGTVAAGEVALKPADFGRHGHSGHRDSGQRDPRSV